MSWATTALVLGVLALVIAAYGTWAWLELERARDKRAALRVEMERGVVAGFATAIGDVQDGLKKLDRRVESLAINQPRR